MCGVCNGTNSTCDFVADVYTEDLGERK